MSSSYDRERKIGALGTGIRLVVASILIVVPIMRAGFAPWDLIGALVVFPLMAAGIDRLLSDGIKRVGPPALPARSSGLAAIWYLNVAVLVLVLALAIGLTYVTPIWRRLAATRVARSMRLRTHSLDIATRSDASPLRHWTHLRLDGPRRRRRSRVVLIEPKGTEETEMTLEVIVVPAADVGRRTSMPDDRLGQKREAPPSASRARIPMKASA
jgi:hypothetical protein